MGKLYLLGETSIQIGSWKQTDNLKSVKMSRVER